MHALYENNGKELTSSTVEYGKNRVSRGFFI
jgi:hypothetical protein